MHCRSNAIFDTGAAAGSYMSEESGFDQRTIRAAHTVINGIGDGTSAAEYGGTVYVKVPARVVLPGGKELVREEVVRFDALYAPKLIKGGTALISHASFVYDGGFHGLRKASPVEFGKESTHTAPGDVMLQVGAVGALTDCTKRVEVRLQASEGLQWIPSYKPLSQQEIERLVPDPPKSLVVFSEHIPELASN